MLATNQRKDRIFIFWGPI